MKRNEQHSEELWMSSRENTLRIIRIPEKQKTNQIKKTSQRNNRSEFSKVEEDGHPNPEVQQFLAKIDPE